MKSNNEQFPKYITIVKFKNTFLKIHDRKITRYLKTSTLKLLL